MALKQSQQHPGSWHLSDKTGDTSSFLFCLGSREAQRQGPCSIPAGYLHSPYFLLPCFSGFIKEIAFVSFANSLIAILGKRHQPSCKKTDEFNWSTRKIHLEDSECSDQPVHTGHTRDTSSALIAGRMAVMTLSNNQR